MGRRILSLPDNLSYLCDPEDEEFTPHSAQLTRRVRHLNNTLNHFWNRWRTEYLSELREAHKYSMGKTHATKKSSLSVGDVVVVHNEQLPRGLWKLGRVQELLEGCDGHHRGAVVKTMTSDGRPELLRRPIQRLYPLEVKGSSDRNETAAENASRPEVTSPGDKPPIDNVGEDRFTEGAVTSAESQSRPRRIAAQRGEEQRKACMIELEED